MDSIKVAKVSPCFIIVHFGSKPPDPCFSDCLSSSLPLDQVDRVLCTRPTSKAYGTVHLTAHHLIFCFDAVEDEGAEPEKEMWVSSPVQS